MIEYIIIGYHGVEIKALFLFYSVLLIKSHGRQQRSSVAMDLAR